MPPAGHALWAEVGGGITFVTSGGILKNHKTAYMYLWEQWEDVGAYMLALVGQPSLHGNYACMVYWAKGALRRNCRLKQCKTSFSPYWVFFSV